MNIIILLRNLFVLPHSRYYLSNLEARFICNMCLLGYGRERSRGRPWQWYPWLHWAAHLSMNPQVQLWWWGACPAAPKTKTQRFCRTYPCTSELCSAHSVPPPPTDPMPLVNKPASTFPVVTGFPLSSWYGSRAGPIKLALFPTPGQEFSGSSVLPFSPRVI